MSYLETIILPHLEQYPVYAALFENVENASFLRDQLLQGNTDFEYTFLDASMILSRDHLLAACFKAINDMSNDRLKTRNVHSEIVFALSPNNNIAESFRRFGLSPESKNIIALKVASTPDITQASVQSHLFEHIKGQPSELNDNRLSQLRDIARLRKVYKFELKMDNQKTILTDDATILSSVIGTMALRGL
ncbi:kinase binding protein CGI-121-domain-containing protein [Elsinoe ampelina]|uniref:EKC/KEOPS complex subunit CGI121 n=1 Tax=Elsinoe ampelina TaxID=302913 RepID=A0A6A6GHE3_9PEZI|nr:kinase binding protein CGI-121-domain-containing protein [Elsinoe ampelina]